MTKAELDLSQWMTNLPDTLRKMPLIYLAIPGSHDSMSYGINRKSKLSPDAEPILRNVFKFLPFVVRRWSITQRFSCKFQLYNGIRYFDLRVAFNSSDHKIYFVHSLYAEEIETAFEDMAEYLQGYPQEVVIIDFQHFHEFNKDVHKKLKDYIVSRFGEVLYGRNHGKTELRDITLNKAAELKKQLIVIYREDSELIDQFWYSKQWPTQWPNVQSTSDLKYVLEAKLKRRKFKQGVVSQAIITPDAAFIIPRFFSTLEKQCAKRVQQSLFPKWLPDRMPGEFSGQELPTVNVIIADFVDLGEFEFCKIVVMLNYKLLKDKSEEDEETEEKSTEQVEQ